MTSSLRVFLRACWHASLTFPGGRPRNKMDSKFRSFWAFRKTDKTSSRTNTSNALLTADQNVPDSRPRTANSWFGRARDSPSIFRGPEAAGELFQASPYEVATPGKAPIYVGTPVHGNGPVKLQTSHRLATGELVQTDQAHEAILEEIRDGDGEYIVGRKETRKSFSSSTGVRPRRQISKEDIKHMEYVPFRVPSPVDEVPALRRDSKMSATSSERGRRSRASSQTYPRRVGQTPPPVPRRSVSLSPTRESIGSAEEEPNLAIEALWKAENTRLATLFTPAENEQPKGLGIQSRPDSSTRRDSWSQQGQMENGSPLLPPRAFSPQSSRASPSMGMSPSLSEAASLWSHDARSTAQSPSLQSPREDVRIMIENMRSTYLTALETKVSHSARVQATRKRASSRGSRLPYQTSPSLTDLTATAQSEPKRSSGRRSWNGSYPDAIVKSKAPGPQNDPVLRKQRSAQNIPTSSYALNKCPPPPIAAPPSTALPPVPQDVEEDLQMAEILQGSQEESPYQDRSSQESTARPTLARADSLTLGSLMKSKKSQKSQSRKASRNRYREHQDSAPWPTETPDRSRTTSIRESIPSSISTDDFPLSTPDRSCDSLRPMTTSTIGTLCSSTTSASFSTAASSTIPSTPNSRPSNSPTPSQTPTIVPQRYLYDPDDSWSNDFNFDVFFYDNSAAGESVLRKFKPKQQSSPSTSMSQTPSMGMPATICPSADSSLRDDTFAF